VNGRGHGPLSLVGVILGLAVQAFPFTGTWGTPFSWLVFATIPTIGLSLSVLPGRSRQLGVGLMASGLAYPFGIATAVVVLSGPLPFVVVVAPTVTVVLLLYAIPVIIGDARRRASRSCLREGNAP